MEVKIPTPSVLSQQYINRISPLPDFSWANAKEVWDLMVHKESVYQRNVLMLHRHSALQPRMRSILVDWLSEVCEVYNLLRETYYLAVDLIDRFLSLQSDIPKHHLQLIGITCLFIAAKIEEIYPPKLSEFAYVTDGACTEDEIIINELVILKALKWGLYPMTVNSWLTVYMQLYASLEKENAIQRQNGDSFMIPDYSAELFAQIAHLLDLCILDIGTLNFPYSVIAASALYHFTSETVVYQCTGLQLEEIRDCIVWMIPFALTIRDEGFDSKVIKKGVDEDSLSNLQSHTVDLKLLEKAQSRQIEQSSSEEEASSASFGSPVAAAKSSSNFLTPPKSTTKRQKTFAPEKKEGLRSQRASRRVSKRLEKKKI